MDSNKIIDPVMVNTRSATTIDVEVEAGAVETRLPNLFVVRLKMPVLLDEISVLAVVVCVVRREIDTETPVLLLVDDDRIEMLVDVILVVVVVLADVLLLVVGVPVDVLLVVVTVLWDLVEDSALRGLDRTVLDYVANNRRTVHQLNDLIENSHIFPGCNNVPMEIVGLPSGISSRWLWHEARDMNIDILPAHNYFYRSAERGDQMFRVPLARPMDEIENAVDILATLIGRLRNQC